MGRRSKNINNNNKQQSKKKNVLLLLMVFSCIGIKYLIYPTLQQHSVFGSIATEAEANNNPQYLYTHDREKTSDFALAQRESLGFFDDVTSAHWNLLKKKVSDMSPNYNTWYLPHDETRTEGAYKRNRKMGQFYQNNYEPDFVCQHERRIGKKGDGGKWICDPHRIAQQESCLVYSIGSNNDFSFEEFVHKDIGAHCEIHTFDFGDYGAGAVKAGVHYHRVGLGGDNPPKFKSLSTVIQELGHEGRTIDIFKIDCEGCEWKTSNEWFTANVTLRQIQVELHNSDVIETPKFFDLMYNNNYVITHKEPNIAYPGAIEYALLKLNPTFSEGIERAKGVPPAAKKD